MHLAQTKPIGAKPPEPLLPAPCLLNINLADITYTLQVGREPMEKRLATFVSTIPELLKKLIQYIRGEGNIDNFYTATVNPDKTQWASLLDHDIKEYLTQKIDVEPFFIKSSIKRLIIISNGEQVLVSGEQ